MTFTCELVQRNLSLFLYGELKIEDEERVQQHLEACEPCRKALEQVTQIHHALDVAEPQVPDTLLVSARRGLHERLSAQAEVSGQSSFWQKLFGSSAGWVLKPAGALAVIALSFFGGRMTNIQVAGVAPEIDLPTATRVRYVEPDPSGKGVQIALDETRQRVVSGSMEDPSIRELLLTAAKDPTDPGLRAESVEMLCSRSQEAEVRDALLAALEHDANAGVRLKALDGLKAFAKDQTTRQTLARVLLKDTNPGVRAQAIDVLTQVRNRDMIAPLQELMRKEDNDYVRLRTQRVLNEMNASPGIF